MSHYKSNLRDIEFNLFEVLGRDEVLGTGPFEEIDVDTARSILAEVDRLAREELADVLRGRRPQPAGLRPGDQHRAVPGVVQEELPGLDGRRVLAPRHDGRARRHPGPLERSTGRSASWCSAPTPPIWMYAAGPTFAGVSTATATTATSRSPSSSSTSGWGATMVLTEPDAGSDVGAGRTKATPNDDGTWHIEGVKRFITSGEHDLTENIVHLVLARPGASRAPAAPAPRACPCSSCRSSTSTSRPAS